MSDTNRHCYDVCSLSAQLWRRDHCLPQQTGSIVKRNAFASPISLCTARSLEIDFCAAKLPCRCKGHISRQKRQNVASRWANSGRIGPTLHQNSPSLSRSIEEIKLYPLFKIEDIFSPNGKETRKPGEEKGENHSGQWSQVIHRRCRLYTYISGNKDKEQKTGRSKKHHNFWGIGDIRSKRPRSSLVMSIHTSLSLFPVQTIDRTHSRADPRGLDSRHQS